MQNNVFDYIKQEEKNYRQVRIPLTSSKDWNMAEHIERCTNVANAWFHSGNNDGNRPYDDIVTPIINVAFRSEGFDVKDIVPFVDNMDESHKSFIIKKYHPQWARKHELDTFIDDVVESSIIYDLVLVKNVNNIRPEVVDLKTLAFCDQTDVMAGPICIKHNYTIADLVEFKGKWDSDAIDQAIVMSLEEKTTGTSDGKAKMPSKYIETYELRGNLPDYWLNPEGSMTEYTPQMHIVCYYKTADGEKHGITLYKGKDKPLSDNFKSLKIDRVRSKGRACGRSIVESLFESQVWRNYDAIKIKGLLDSAFNLIISDSEELGNQKLTELKSNTVLKQEKGANTQRFNSDLSNLTAFSNHQIQLENSARVIGSASDAQLGTNPVSGTPFALQSLVVQQGQGMHEYRQGKIASFFADILYRDWILKYLVDDLNSGKKFSEILSYDEMKEIADKVVMNKMNDRKIQMLKEGKIMNPDEEAQLDEMLRTEFMSSGERNFFEIIKGELESVPISVMVNIKQKQRDMSAYADKITNVIREVLRDPVKFSQVPGIGKAFNQLLENAGLSPIDFSGITKAQPAPAPQVSEAEVVTA